MCHLVKERRILSQNFQHGNIQESRVKLVFLFHAVAVPSFHYALYQYFIQNTTHVLYSIYIYIYIYICQTHRHIFIIVCNIDYKKRQNLTNHSITHQCTRTISDVDVDDCWRCMAYVKSLIIFTREMGNPLTLKPIYVNVLGSPKTMTDFESEH